MTNAAMCAAPHKPTARASNADSVSPAGATPAMASMRANTTHAVAASQVRVMTAAHEAPAFAMSLNISVCNLGIGLGAALGGRIVNQYGVGAVGYGGAAVAAAALLIAIA
jgi:MFS transporter, DHA1 family, inner membrane transport protein